MRRGRSRYGGRDGAADVFKLYVPCGAGSKDAERTEEAPQPMGQMGQNRAPCSWNSEMFLALWDAVVRLRSKGVNHPVRLVQRPDISPPEATISWEDGPSVDVLKNILTGHIGERRFRSGDCFSVRLERVYSKEALEAGRKTFDCKGDEKALLCVMDGRSFYSAKRRDVIERYKPDLDGPDKDRSQGFAMNPPTGSDER